MQKHLKHKIIFTAKISLSMVYYIIHISRQVLHTYLIPYSWKFFAGPNFRENPISPPEEIFTVLISVFSASYWPRPFIISGLTEDERSPVGDGRTSSASFRQRYSAIVRSSETIAHKTHIRKFPQVQMFTQKFTCSNLRGYFTVLIFAFRS